MRERKFRKKRLPHKVYLAICEGETEKSYVELLRRHYRVPVTIKTRVSGNSINSRLVDQYIRELGVGSAEECRVFCIYDADVQPVVERLQSLGGTVILTNPCFELWYILHSVEHRHPVDSDEVIKMLKDSHPVWEKYMKGRLTADQSELLMTNSSDAVRRASKLTWPGNPSSNMGAFIEALENLKNR